MTPKPVDLSLKGQVDRDVAALFAETLASVAREDGPVTINMEDADVDDPVVTASLIEHLREAARRLGSLVVVRPPQVLAHGLYRVGALSGTLRVIEPREELGTSS